MAKIKKELKQVIICLLVIETIAFVYIQLNHKYISDYFGVKLDSTFYGELLLYLVTVIFYFLICNGLLLIRHIKVIKIRAGVLTNGYFEIFFLILSTLYLYQVMFSDVGRVSIVNNTKESYSLIEQLIIYFNAIFRFNFLVYIYACLKESKDKGKIYWLTIIIFLLSEMLRGVSFPIFLFIVIEFDRIKKLGLRFFIIIIPVSVWVVNLIYNFKFKIRYLNSMDYSYFDTTAMAIGRLSTLSNSSFFLNNFDAITHYSSSLSSETSIYSDFFSRLTPFPSLFSVREDFINYGNVIFSFTHDHYSSSTALLYPLQLFMYNPRDLLVSVIVTLISSVLILLIARVIDKTGRLFYFSIIYIIFFFTQSFYGLLASYLYALVVYSLLCLFANKISNKKYV